MKLICTIIFAIILHIVMVKNKKWINSHLKSNTIYKGKRVHLYFNGGNPSLMVTVRHFTKDAEEYTDGDFAKQIWIRFGGFMFLFKYGHDFLEADHYTFSDDISKYYGVMSYDGEIPSTLWWGNNIYDLIWFRTQFVGTYLFDLDTCGFTEVHDIVSYPPTIELNDTTYTCKNDMVKPCKNIKFWLVERRYESKILQWLGVAHLFQKKHVYLEFDTTGIGHDYDDDNFVTGSSIVLRETTDGELLDLYHHMISGHVNMKSRLHLKLMNRVHDFMTHDKNY